MSVQVTILPSQFPTRLREDQIRCLRLRCIENKHHYETANQVQKWMALHKAYSPSQTKTDCKALFDHCFEVASRNLCSQTVHVVGLGAGDGTKEQRLIRVLKDSGRKVIFSPVDVGVAMVLEAREKALNEIPTSQCAPIVCDVAKEPALLTATDEVLSSLNVPPWEVTRVFTFFGMLPSFAPSEILPRLHALLRGNECALVSANLTAPKDQPLARDQVLPLYDNQPTRAWLLTFLQDLGLDTNCGEIIFRAEEDEIETGILRITAYFNFNRDCEITMGNDSTASFERGDSIPLFASYRYSFGQLYATLLRYGFRIEQSWVTNEHD